MKRVIAAFNGGPAISKSFCCARCSSIGKHLIAHVGNIVYFLCTEDRFDSITKKWDPHTATDKNHITDTFWRRSLLFQSRLKKLNATLDYSLGKLLKLFSRESNIELVELLYVKLHLNG